MFGELASATWKRQLLTELSYDTMNHFVHRYSTYTDCVTFREIKVYLVCDFTERAVQNKKITCIKMVFLGGSIPVLFTPS